MKAAPDVGNSLLGHRAIAAAATGKTDVLGEVETPEEETA